MKHYEVRNEETDTDRPPQTHSFSSQDHGTRALPFSSIAPSSPIPRRGIRTAQAQWVLVSRLHSYIAVRMCVGGIYNSATQAVLGVPFLGVSAGPGNLAGFLHLPMQDELQTWEGGARVRDPCFRS